jgi:hypothetical protein
MVMVLVWTVAHQQALRPRVDQAGAELREIQHARDQREQARDVERDDAAGEAGETEREEELPGAAQPSQRPLPSLRGLAFDDGIVERERR